MPELLRYRQEGRVENQTGVTRQARRSFDEPNMGDVVSLAGEALGRIEASRAASQTASALLATREQLTLYERDLQQQNISPADYQSLYDARAREIVTEQEERIGSRDARAQFSMQAGELVVDHRLRVDTAARSRSADMARGAAQEVEDHFGRLADDPAYSQDDVDEAERTWRGVINNNRQLGIYTAEQAAGLESRAEERSIAARSLRHSTILDEAMDGGQWALAREHFTANAAEMTPRDRAAYETVIEERGREAEAFQRADQFWTASGGDYGRALEAARSIGNMDERRAVEGRIAELKAQDDAAVQADYRTSASGAWDHVLTGGSLSNMPSEIMAGLSGQERIQIRDYVERRRQDMADRAARAGSAEAAPQIDEALSTEMGNMILAEVALLPGGNTLTLGQMQEASPRAFEMFEMLRPDDQLRVLTQMTQRATEGGASPAVDSLFRSLTQAATLRIPPPATGTRKEAQRDLRDLASAQEPDDGGWTDAERALRQHLYIQAEQWARDNPGQDPTPQQRREMVSRAYANSDPERFPRRVNVLDPENIGIDPGLARQAASLAREVLGREPTNEEVLTYYRQIMAGEE